MTIQQINIIIFIFLICEKIPGQDLYNPALISQLKVKSIIEIRFGPFSTDTTVLKYDTRGRKVYRKSPKGCMQGIDSIFYIKSSEIRKNYSDELKLKLIDKKTTLDNGNTVIYDFVQFLSPTETSHKITTLKFKESVLIYRKQIENDKVTDVFDVKENSKNSKVDKSKLTTSNDSAFDYLDNNEEYLEVKENGKLISYLIFNSSGQIIASRNYAQTKGNEVRIFYRKYNPDTKTFTETISTQTYFDNGLLKNWLDNEYNAKTIYIYEFY